MDISRLCRRLSLVLPVAFVIVQILIYLMLPDTVPQHVASDGSVDGWTEKGSVASVVIYLLLPMSTLVVSAVLECISIKRVLDSEVSRDRAVVSILYTCVLVFILIMMDSAALKIV